MADASRSPLAPVEGLSFQTCAMIGAAIGLGLLLVAWGIGPGDSHGSTSGHANSSGVAHSGDPSAKGGADGGGADGGGADGGGADGGAADGGNGNGGGAGEGQAGGDDDGAGNGGADDADEASANGAEDDAAEGGDAGDDAGNADDAVDDTAEGDEPTTGDDDEMVIEDDDAAAAGGDGNDTAGKARQDSGSSNSSSSTSPGAPDPTSDMTADELREEATKALKEKRYRDAYRLSTRSYYKKKDNGTLLIKGKAACGMKDDKAAKAAVKALPRGDERRKDIRTYCRDRGVRVGL